MKPKLTLPFNSDSEIHMNGYTIIRKDRTKNEGGIAFYIKNTYILLLIKISYSDRNDLIPDSENLEIICVEINKRYCTSFIISNWYRPLNSKLELFDNFESFCPNMT